MARVIAFANQKGGVAKTTTTLSIGAALAEQGRDVLLVDLDAQGALTYSLGLEPDSLQETVNYVLVRSLPLEKALVAADLDLVPANIDLAGAEAVLLSKTGREYMLQRALRDVDARYDYVLIDCPPSLGILTINGLTAASEVLVPLQAEALSHRGVGQLLEILEDVESRYGVSVLEPFVPKSIRFAEAARAGRAITSYAPSHKGAEAYRGLARRIDQST
jgi:chromosome partitioning protein